MDDLEGPMTDSPAPENQSTAGSQKLFKQLTYCLWGVSFIAALWGWIAPRPYAPIVLANTLLPLLGLPLVFYSHGRIAVVFMGKDEPLQISPPFLLCGLVLCLRALDRPILGSSTALVYAALAALPLAALAWWLGDKRGTVVNTVAALIIGLIFSGGAVVSLNRVLDPSSAMSEYAKVSQKYVSGSRSKAYILSVFTKQAPSRPVGFAVDAGTYERASVGDTLLVQEHKGAFGLPWFDLRGLFSEPSTR